MTTIGEAIENEVDKYFGVYKSLRELGSIKDPKSLATTDLWVRQYIANEAIKILNEKIEAYEEVFEK